MMDAYAAQKQYDAIGDEPQPLPDGVNLYWGNDPDRQDQYELWRWPVSPDNYMKVSGNPYTKQTIRWYSRYGMVPYLTVTIAGWYARWYTGQAKIDGTRTQMLWNGELGGNGPAMKAAGLYVVNRWPQELWSVRWHGDKLDLYRWDNQGGI
jgi:hypothetical protein